MASSQESRRRGSFIGSSSNPLQGLSRGSRMQPALGRASENPLAARRSTGAGAARPGAAGAAATAGASASKSATVSASRSVKISDSGFTDLVAYLESLDGNNARLAHLESNVEGVLFSCAQLKRMMEITPSVKTRLRMVDIIGPRVTDPKRSAEIIELFRYSEEKAHATQVLRAREQLVGRDTFGSASLSATGAAGGRGAPGRGLRGRGGRGRGGRAGRSGLRGRGGRGGRGIAAAPRITAPAAPAAAAPGGESAGASASKGPGSGDAKTGSKDGASSPKVSEDKVMPSAPAPQQKAAPPAAAAEPQRAAPSAPAASAEAAASTRARSATGGSAETADVGARPRGVSMPSAPREPVSQRDMEKAAVRAAARGGVRSVRFTSGAGAKAESESKGQRAMKAMNPLAKARAGVHAEQSQLHLAPTAVKEPETTGRRSSFRSNASTLTMALEAGERIVPYEELVHRNKHKDYGRLDSNALETYLADDEFAEKFGMDREAFYAMPRWRQKMKKQMASLW